MLKRSIFAAVFFALACPALLSLGAGFSPAAGAGRVLLPGNVSPRAKPEFDQGPSDPSLAMRRMTLLLKIAPRKQAQLDQLVARQQDTSSSNYHKWLTPAEFGRRFGRSPEEIATVKNWLLSQGFTVDSVSNSATRISFSGTAADLDRAFEADMHDYQVKGRLRHANSMDPSIPGVLANLVVGPVSLNTFRRKPAHGAARPLSTGDLKPGYTVGGAGSGNLGPGYYLSPGDFAAVYDVNNIYSLGYTGGGVTIAVIGQAPADTAMWAKFRSAFGVPYNTPNVIVVGNQPPVDDGQGDVEESDIDVEWTSAVAPAATIDFVTASVDAGGIDTAAEYVVDNNLAPILSLSYDLCESDLGASGNQYYSGLWEQAAAEGITVFVASGDSGAYDCTDSRQKAVNGIASTPYNVAVGGTSLSNSPIYWSSTNSPTDVSALSSIPTLPEAAWNDYSSSGRWTEYASGGGASAVYTKPAWQVCPGVPGDGRRDVPDVSLNADPYGVGFLVYTCNDDSSKCASNSYGLYAFGGTSCAAPPFAAIMALIEQSLGGWPQGNANTVFYQLGNAQYSGTSTTDPVFNDITSGGNGFVGNGTTLPGYSCTTAYDQVTGLGSVDATRLLLAYQEFGGLWAGAKDLGGGWKYLGWFGFFYTDSFPWVFHQTLGWLHPSGSSMKNIWFYDIAMKTFWWTSQTLYPYIYRSSDNAWLYYEPGTSNPRRFYNYSTKSWESD